MRVAINAMLLRPPYTGVQRYIKGLIEALAVHVPEVELTAYIGRGHGWTPEGIDNVKLRTACVPAAVRPLRICWEQLMLPFSLRRRKTELFHAPGYVMPMLAPVIARIPTVLTVHDVMALERPELASSCNAFHYGLILPASVRLARCVIVPTKAVADRLAALSLTARRVEVVPWGVEETFFRAGQDGNPEETLASFNIDTPFVLHVGRTDPKKNIDRIIKAFFAMKMDASLPHHLIIAGAGGRSHKKLVRLVYDLRIDEYVRFIGHVSDEALAHLYARADLVVCASIDEGFGFPALEALAAGTAVVASRIPAFDEVLGGEVSQVAPDDLPGLRAAMTELLTDDRARNDAAERGRKRAKQYTWRECARRTCEIYEQSLTG